MSNEQRVVVTGMGAVSPLGRGVAALWDGLLAGRSGVRPLQGLDLTGQEVDFGGQAIDFDPSDVLEPKAFTSARFTCCAAGAPVTMFRPADAGSGAVRFSVGCTRPSRIAQIVAMEPSPPAAPRV